MQGVEPAGNEPPRVVTDRETSCPATTESHLPRSLLQGSWRDQRWQIVEGVLVWKLLDTRRVRAQGLVEDARQWPTGEPDRLQVDAAQPLGHPSHALLQHAD